MIVVRPGVQDDLPFIYSSWLGTYKNSKAKRLLSHPALLPYARLAEPSRSAPSLYYALHKAWITATLSRSSVLVAAYENDPSLVIGYIVYQPSTLHYVCVKEDYQGEGVGKMLVSHAGITGKVTCTCVPDYINLPRASAAVGAQLETENHGWQVPKHD